MLTKLIEFIGLFELLYQPINHQLLTSDICPLTFVLWPPFSLLWAIRYELFFPHLHTFSASHPLSFVLCSPTSVLWPLTSDLWLLSSIRCSQLPLSKSAGAFHRGCSAPPTAPPDPLAGRRGLSTVVWSDLLRVVICMPARRSDHDSFKRPSNSMR